MVSQTQSQEEMPECPSPSAQTLPVCRAALSSVDTNFLKLVVGTETRDVRGDNPEKAGAKWRGS